MGKLTKVPSQAASGAETFSDALVGVQITNGSNQLTNTNFEIDREIPEKDSKNFVTQPFSDFFTLNDINIESSTGNSTSTSGKSPGIRFKNSYDNGNCSLYGSLKERIGVSITNIINTFPAGALVDSTSPVGVNSFSAESIVYDSTGNTTEFILQYSIIFNPLDIVFVKPKSSILPETNNAIRDFFSSYTQYVIDISGNTYNILNYITPDVTNKITLKVSGECFPGITGTTYSDNYVIRPNNGVIEGFYDELDILESTLLNRETTPIYQSNFYVPTDKNEGNTSDVISVQVNWPVSRDGHNIQISGLDYDFYIDKLSSLAEEIDNYKSNLIIRFLTAPQLFEFDTDEKKIQSIFQIYGQSFDEVKKYIDNIVYMRNVSYDGINNIPDIFLKNLAETLGLSTANLFNEKTLEEAVYTRHDVKYLGISTGINLIEAEYEIYRRMLVNLAYLYKSKGTRIAIEFFLKFIGAPDPLIVINEYIYKVDGSLPINNDINELINGHKTYNVATYVETGYTITTTTGYTSLTRSEYPIDEITGLPRKLTSSDGSLFFETGAGWYQKTLDHRSSEILDATNSELTKRSKVIKSIPKPFTHGEDYFNNFRKLPGLYYGFNLTSGIDNKKTENVIDENTSKLTLNRKNVNIFLSPSQVIDYDIYRKSRNLNIDFGMPVIPYDDTFEEFSSKIITENVNNLYDSKYEYTYTGLTNVYEIYMSGGTGYTPYNFTSVNDFVNKIGPNWVSMVEQFIPATTLWLGGNLISNGIFGRSKYRHQPEWWYTYSGVNPPPTPPPSPSPTPSVTPTMTPSLTRTPSITPSMTKTPGMTPSVTSSIPLSRTPTPTPSTSNVSLQCNVEHRYSDIGGSSYPSINVIQLGTGVGDVRLDINNFGSPDKYIVVYDGIVKIDTGYYGDISLQTDLNDVLTGITGTTVITGIIGGDYVVSSGGTETINSGSTMSFPFVKTGSTPTTAIVYVYSPLEPLGWTFNLTCPYQPVPSRTPTMTVTPTMTPSSIPYYYYNVIEYVNRNGSCVENTGRVVANVYNIDSYIGNYYISNNGDETCIFSIESIGIPDPGIGSLITNMNGSGYGAFGDACDYLTSLLPE